MSYNRRLQLLMDGEPDPLGQKGHYYMGVDLGVRVISAAVICHREGNIFHIDNISAWSGMSHDPYIGALIDAWRIRKGWVDQYNSAAIVSAFKPMTQIRMSQSARYRVYQNARDIVDSGRLATKSHPVAGKPSDYFDRLVECVRSLPNEIDIDHDTDISQSDADKDQYLMAFCLALWGAEIGRREEPSG